MVLEMRNAACGYGRQAILRDVSLQVASGELVCLLGPNGVGKTTMFKSMLGFLDLLDGQVLLDGTDRAGDLPEGVLPEDRLCAPVPRAALPLHSDGCGGQGRTAHLKGSPHPAGRTTCWPMRCWSGWGSAI